jgi:hypothetical protein
MVEVRAACAALKAPESGRSPSRRRVPSFGPDPLGVGSPGYRDATFRSAEGAATDTMMICCPGAKTERLTLDL